jgi:hypothetical protein
MTRGFKVLDMFTTCGVPAHLHNNWYIIDPHTNEILGPHARLPLTNMQLVLAFAFRLFDQPTDENLIEVSPQEYVPVGLHPDRISMYLFSVSMVFLEVRVTQPTAGQPCYVLFQILLVAPQFGSIPVISAADAQLVPHGYPALAAAFQNGDLVDPLIQRNSIEWNRPATFRRDKKWEDGSYISSIDAILVNRCAFSHMKLVW